MFGPNIWFPDLHHIHENSIETLGPKYSIVIQHKNTKIYLLIHIQPNICNELWVISYCQVNVHALDYEWKVLRKCCIILWYNIWPHFLGYSWMNTDSYSYTSTTRYNKYWIMLVAIQWKYRTMNKYTWTYTVSSQSKI